MSLPFRNLPSNIRVPLFYAEVDNSQANNASQVQRTLIIGQMFTTGDLAGTATPGVPVICGGPADAAALAGPGSMVHLMALAYFANDPFGEVHLLPLADDGAATDAVGSVDFTAAATAAGTLSLYIAGVRVQMAVTTSQTTAQLATALIAAINAVPNLPVVAAIDGVDNTKVNLTALNAGPGGNGIDVRLNYGGVAAGEATPTGLAATIVQPTGGATAPSLTTPLANLGDTPYDFIVLPYTDSTSLNALRDLLNDTTGRWSWASQVYGHVFTAYRDSYANLVTFGGGRNDQHATVMGFNNSPTPAWVWAAAVAGAVAPSLRNYAPQPLQTLGVQGVLAPPVASRFTRSQQNTLLYTGISTFNVADDGSVSIQRLVTTYRENVYGQPDDSYLPVERLYQLAFVLRFLAIRVTSKYARMALADDGTRFAPGTPIVTPSVIRGDQIAAYRELEFRGYVQAADAFARGLIVQRNAGDRNRIDVLWAGTLVNQLNIFALLAQFRV